MKKLLLIDYRENKSFALILLAVLGIVTVLFTLMLSYNRGGVIRSYGIGGFLNILEVTLLVIMVNSFIYNKRKPEIDFYYSLAISKRKLVIAKIIYDWLLFSILSLCAFVIYAFTMWVHVDYIDISLGKLIGYFLLGYSLILLSYLFVLPFFYYGNSVFDGFLYIILIIAALVIISSFIEDLSNRNISDYFYKNSFRLSPYYLVTYFNTGMENSLQDAVGLNVKLGIDFIISIIMVFGVFISFLFTLRFDENERAGQISNKIFGYKLFIPLLTYSLTVYLAMLSSRFEIVYVGIILILHFILVLISQRGFKITKKTLYIYLIEMAVLVIGFLVINSTFH